MIVSKKFDIFSILAGKIINFFPSVWPIDGFAGSPERPSRRVLTSYDGACIRVPHNTSFARAAKVSGIRRIQFF